MKLECFAQPVVRQYTPTGPELEPAEGLEERHLRVLLSLGARALLAERDHNDMKQEEAPAAGDGDGDGAATDDAMSEAASTSVSASARLQSRTFAHVQVMRDRLGAAHREAEQLAKLLALLHGRRHIQSASREASIPEPPPPAPAMRMHLKRKQHLTASSQLTQGARELRASGARAARALSEARALRAHWRLLELSAPSTTEGALSRTRHVLRIEVCAAGATGAAGFGGVSTGASVLTVGEAEAAALAARQMREVELRSDAHGSLRLSPSVGTHVEVLRLSYGLDGPRATPPFVSAAAARVARVVASTGAAADDELPRGMTMDVDVPVPADSGEASAPAERPAKKDEKESHVNDVHRRLLATQLSLHTRAIFERLGFEARAQATGRSLPGLRATGSGGSGGSGGNGGGVLVAPAAALLGVRSRVLLLECAHAPGHTLEIGLDRAGLAHSAPANKGAEIVDEIDAAKGGVSSEEGLPSMASPAVCVGSLEIGLLTLWFRYQRATYDVERHAADGDVAAPKAGASYSIGEQELRKLFGGAIAARPAPKPGPAAAAQAAKEAKEAKARAEAAALARQPPPPSLLPYALSAASLDAQQRVLRVALDAISCRWGSPRLIVNWTYGKVGALSATVEAHIVCSAGGLAMPRSDGWRARGVSTCCAISAVLQGGRVHAQPIALRPTAGTGIRAVSGALPGRPADATVAFPLEAVTAVGLSEDGCGSFAALVHSALGRVLLHRLSALAVSAGLAAHASLCGTQLVVHRAPPAGATQEVALAAVDMVATWEGVGAPWGSTRPLPPWVSVRLCGLDEAAPKAAPKIAVLLQREGETRPHAVDVGGELRGGGRGELEELARLVVKEVLG